MHNDGLVHTVFNTVFTATGRLSSSSPNVQNYPIRDSPWVRKMFVAPQGHKFMKLDYGQIEARVIAMMSKDKVLSAALWEKYDIHLDWAEKFSKVKPSLLDSKLDKKVAMKKLRSRIKSLVVFAAFYGSGSPSISKSLGMSLKETEKLLDEFWKEFSGVRTWQQKLRRDYEKNGYVQCLTGRRRRAPLDYTKLINTPVQGTASDIVVDAMSRLSMLSTRTKQPQYQAVMNIHDDLSFYLPVNSIDKDMEVIIDTVLKCPFDFVDVPLSVEVSVGDNWFSMSEVGTFFSNEW